MFWDNWALFVFQLPPSFGLNPGQQSTLAFVLFVLKEFRD